MKAVKAVLSASSDAAAKGDGESAGWPFLSVRCGYLSGASFHPLRHVVLAAVLPGGEPKQNQANAMLASLGEERVDHGVVVLPLPGFKLLPVDRDFHRVDVEVF